VLWAIGTNFEADRDFAMVPGALGSHLDPAAYGEVSTEFTARKRKFRR